MEAELPSDDRGELPWQEQVRPRVVDGAMIVLGVATTMLWSGGMGIAAFVGIAWMWVMLWIWRLGTPGWKIWGPLAALVTVLIALQGGLHVAERAARGCTTDLAVELLETEPIVDVETATQIASNGNTFAGAPDIRRPGRCGLLDWRHAAVIDINERRRRRGDVPDTAHNAPAVVLYSAGPERGFLYAGRRGYVYSPIVAPSSCRDVTASTADNQCTVTARGGGWYFYVADSSWN